MTAFRFSEALLKNKRSLEKFGHVDRIALLYAIAQCLHYYLFEELGKHYPIAGLMQLDQLDPIAPLRYRDNLSQLLSPTQSANLVL